MANAVTGNKIYVDSTGALTTKRTKVSSILFTPSAANDQMVLRETSSGSDCLVIQSSTAKTTLHFDFSLKPMVFNNGIYVQTLTSGAKATIVTTESGE